MARKSWLSRKYAWIALILTGGLTALGVYEFVATDRDKAAYLLGTVERGDVVVQVASGQIAKKLARTASLLSTKGILQV